MCYFKVIRRSYPKVDSNVYTEGEIEYRPVLAGGRKKIKNALIRKKLSAGMEFWQVSE